MEEFYEDLRQNDLAKKLAKKISKNKSANIRLLCNHIQCFTNNFDLYGAKKILMFEIEENQKKIIKTVLNYFGFIEVYEMKDTPFCLETAKLLKDMDK